MKMKKSVIYPILIITFLIHMFSALAYAEEAGANEEDHISITEDVNYQAFKWLDMTSPDMDKLYSDSHVSRGQFAYVLAGILGYRSKGVVYSNVVDAQDTIYEGAIDYLVKMKIMPMMPVNKFNPKDDILYKEMLTAAVTALGYMETKPSDQDPDTYALNIAIKIGLTKGISSGYSAALP
ncbi:MAG: hypothetical protein J5874_04555, partial [Oscillospiraceae bacterium]|nr:hypothetical protein [Oscillospiraceae bacterium]